MKVSLDGSPKQVEWAAKILAEAFSSIQECAETVPVFADACIALTLMLEKVSDASWVISNRYNLGLKIGKLYGTDLPTIYPDSFRDHQLLRNEAWRNPALRKGLAGIPAKEAETVRALFFKAQMDQLNAAKGE